ncbi:MAG: hypothetical protein M1827_003479 [Pycnora praestabilis]|nr:MAG: hypothetical protein M1827_003479 [Pycnora praestabilis]
MADSNSSSESTNPNLNLTAEEKLVFGQLFQAADTENIGVVTGEVAVKFFERTKLAPTVLGEIWQIADTENRGLLTPAGFGVVLRLIGHYQAGRDPTPELAFRPGPLPKFDGLTGSANAPTNPPPPAAAALQAQPSGGPIRVPPLTSDKVNEYSSLFEKSGAQNGVLPGETAKQIFERARLPNDVLGRIWNLSDTEQRGALGVTEFIIAMHLLASYKSGALRALPQILPPGLYEAASRRGIPRPQTAGSRPRAPSPGVDKPPIPALPRQFSGQGPPQRTQSPLARPPYNTPPMSAQPTGSDWAISPHDKAQFDIIYASVDKANRGFITGEQAVGFFGNSRLPEEVLATIWDLADINSEGQLNRDEFAVAMYLIRQQRGKRDGRGSLPMTLPPSLIPPSMRQQSRPPPQPTAPTFDNAAAPAQPKSATEDLFGLDAFSSPTPAPAQIQQSTESSSSYSRPFESGMYGNSTQPTSPTSPTRGQGSPQQQSSAFKPFIPSSSFGQNMMTSTPTGGSSNTGPSQSRGLQQPQPSVMDDLLGDNDPEISNKLTQETTELANLSNQVGTLSTQMQEVKSKRMSTEKELADASSQKRDFEVRLSQLRSMYEQEVKDVKALEDRLSISRNETRKLQQDIAMIEGTHEDLQNQHRQIVGALETDQRENTTLKEKMRTVNEEINQLKPQLEKLKSEARQQKGMVAINKKQFATNEVERDRIKTEVEEVSRRNEENARAMQATPATQSPAPVVSPAASITSQSTNPFFRRTQTSISESATSPSPFAREVSPAQNQHSFESVFGPSFPSTSQTSGPPPTSFSSEPQSRDIPTETAPSGLSLRSSEGPDVPTPSTSPPPSSYHESPRSIEPPAPPESRQITSSILPLRDQAQRTDSFSSSVKVSAPASRYGGNDNSDGGDTPTDFVGSAAATPSQDRESLRALERVDTSKTEVGAVDVNPLADTRNVSHSPLMVDSQRTGARPADHRNSYGFERPSGSQDAIPGAFPDTPGNLPSDSNSIVKSQPMGESALSDQSKASTRLSEGFQNNRSDPFALGRDQSRGPTAAKEDFNAAFAGFGGSKQPQERPTTRGSSVDGSVGTSSGDPNRFHREFPPIEEFGNGEDSDSNSERGFDDDFTTASPQQRHTNQRNSQDQNQGPEASRSGPGGLDGTREAFAPRPIATQMESSGQLPTPEFQQSPPSYDQTVSSPNGKPGAHRNSNQFPLEYGGLLPSREDPTSPTSPRDSNSPEKSFNAPMTGGQALFSGSNASKGISSSNAPTAFSSSPPLSNTPLSTAPSDAYQSAVSYPSGGKGPSPPTVTQSSQPAQTSFDDDLFGDLADSREAPDHGDDDFGTSSHQPEGLDEFNPIFDSPAASKSNTIASMASQRTATGNSFPHEDNFSDFEHNIGGPTQASPKGKAPEINANSQDWDAIFAGAGWTEEPEVGLEAPNANASTRPNLPPKEQIAPENSGPYPAPAPTFPSMGTRGVPAPPSTTTAKPPKLAQLGRTLTTEHDDPILKRLTGMGFDRDASLDALEKYDYNLDKAADYLTTKER